MESPHHGAPDPGFHPRIATEAAHSGAYGHCNTIQMYTPVRVGVFGYACAGWGGYTHTHNGALFADGMGICQRGVTAD